MTSENRGREPNGLERINILSKLTIPKCTCTTKDYGACDIQI